MNGGGDDLFGWTSIIVKVEGVIDVLFEPKGESASEKKFIHND